MTKPGHRDRSASLSPLQAWRPTIATAIVLLVVFYSVWQSRQQSPVTPPAVALPPSATESPVEKLSPSSGAAPAFSATVSKQTIRDEDRRVVYRGDIDVGPTLERIESGERLDFPHDGSVFQNRERRLPRQSAGYYKEYVHPTPGLRGPGPQRIVVGAGGEIFYTPDHYRTFQRLDE